MDLKTLFHDPESLNDGELNIMRDKIVMQRAFPWTGAALTGFSAFLLNSIILKRQNNWVLVGAATVTGFVIGGIGSYQVNTSLSKHNDQDIIRAHDRRYMNSVLYQTGFGSNYLSSRDYSENTQLKKPY